MSDRISQYILLCEDDAHSKLVRAYFRKCGISDRLVVDRVASRLAQGGNIGWVLREFDRQLLACRQRQAQTLLIVVIDADDHTVEERRRELNQRSEFRDNDPLVILIPRRHIETWIRSALNEAVNEDDDYKRPAVTKDEFRNAAGQIHGWARNQPEPGPTCIPSLRSALPAWRQIG
jgi:hypothetical protein